MAEPSFQRAESSVSTTLLERVRLKEPEAWRRLVELYTPLLFYWVRRAEVPKRDEEDLVQDCLIQLSRSIARFRRERPGDSFRGWLRVMVRNKLRDYFRKTRRQSERLGVQRPLDEVELAGPEPGRDAAELAALYRRALQLIAREFEPRTLDIFRRLTEAGEPAAEIARTEDLAVGSVYQIKYRVMRRLREELGELLD